MHDELPGFSMPDQEQVDLAVESFRMLADATRLKLLWALLQGESSVACLAELVGASPTAVSQHLAKLRLARLVHGRRDGTFVYYSAADVHVRRLLAEALFHADHTDQTDDTGRGEPHHGHHADHADHADHRDEPRHVRANAPSRRSESG